MVKSWYLFICTAILRGFSSVPKGGKFFKYFSLPSNFTRPFVTRTTTTKRAKWRITYPKTLLSWRKDVRSRDRTNWQWWYIRSQRKWHMVDSNWKPARRWPQWVPRNTPCKSFYNQDDILRSNNRLARPLVAHRCWRCDCLQQLMSWLPWTMVMVAPRLGSINTCSKLKVRQDTAVRSSSSVVFYAILLAQSNLGTDLIVPIRGRSIELMKRIISFWPSHNLLLKHKWILLQSTGLQRVSMVRCCQVAWRGFLSSLLMVSLPITNYYMSKLCVLR